MKRILSALFFTALLAGGATAQTLRWASQGDLQTADPHSQNESMTNMMNGQVYEKLVKRGKDLSIGPGLTALTGETGAGKAIILDALGLATGARADAGLVRQGATPIR